MARPVRRCPAALRRLLVLRRPAARNPRSGSRYSGPSGLSGPSGGHYEQQCRFSTLRIGERARIHPDRDQTTCAFCSAADLEKSWRNARCKGLLTSALAFFAENDESILQAAKDRIRDFMGGAVLKACMSRLRKLLAKDSGEDDAAIAHDSVCLRWCSTANWDKAHYFIRLLHDKGILLRCYSQNIDSLECRAGLPAEKLVAAHGNFDAAHVIDTEPEVLVDINELKAALDKGEEGWRQLRAEKGGLVKPKIVFFGEELPERFAQLHRRDLAACDLLIVMGTSLVVHPFAGLVGYTGRSAPRMLINRDPAGTCDELRMGFRFHLEGDQNWRDVFHKGDCDSGCRALAEALGWKEDMESLIDSKGAATISRAPWAEMEEAPATEGYSS
ncbi:NAD-dependent protein deacetylase sirtuin-2 [Symbiodinium microadriaticum]|uniref:NAD-dependent protein deacetylase sirtuin-2 n=1 Tax=Symbiodinium microadriaticum TaxID=2951 RepID=A0A1Q9E066_SYMMI|nr:NAD-dependent protein deacetylase sirtuin-2 [Symbiodinium microadriaticum]